MLSKTHDNVEQQRTKEVRQVGISIGILVAL